MKRLLRYSPQAARLIRSPLHLNGAAFVDLRVGLTNGILSTQNRFKSIQIANKFFQPISGNRPELLARNFCSKKSTNDPNDTPANETSTTESRLPSLSSFDPKDHLHQNLTNTPIVEQMNQRIQRVVHDLNLGDQLSVVGVVTILCGMVLAPYIIRGIQNSETNFDEQLALSEDPVDDFTKLARKGWGNEEESIDPFESMLKEVLQSQALQEAAKGFCVQILESPEVQDALNRLVKKLWTQLVTDPETVAQVIHLLQVAIQDEKIRQAAQQLVIQLVQDPKVKDALLDLVRELGNDDKVAGSIRELLTSSAHHSLNDPEILEHSMEFASDIVGDDLVQRTARDALWNTVGDAMRPATSILLTAAGVGLVIFGIMCLGYARSSESEAEILSSAARSIQHHASHGIVRFCTWPGRKVNTLMEGVRSSSGHFVQHLWLSLTRMTNIPSKWWGEKLIAWGWLRRKGQPPVPAGYGNYETIWETTSRWSRIILTTSWSGLVDATVFAVRHSLTVARATLRKLQEAHNYVVKVVTCWVTSVFHATEKNVRIYWSRGLDHMIRLTAAFVKGFLDWWQRDPGFSRQS